MSDLPEESATDIELSEDVVETAERLTRLARATTDDSEQKRYRQRRESVLEETGFSARIRTEDTGDVLVLHPEEWHDDGVIRTDRIADLSRAEEISLGGPDDPDDWEAVDENNRELVDRVREEHGDLHGDNVAIFADFMGNHYARPLETAAADEIDEFCSEYFVRNAWPSSIQRKKIRQSLALAFETANEPVPEPLREG